MGNESAEGSAGADGYWAVVLCGGRGSRLGPVTNDRPKPLVEVHGKPILWYVFLSLYRNGVRNFVFPLGYKGKMIEEYVRDISRGMGCNIICVDTGEDAEIADRVATVLPRVPDHADFLILNSDTIFDFDIEEMYRLHKKENALVTLSSVEVVSSWGLILLKADGKLASFERERKVQELRSKEDPSMFGVVNSGIAWLSKDAFAYVDLSVSRDFETDLYSKLIEMGRASHYYLKGSWFPIDTPKDLNIMNFGLADRHESGGVTKAVKERLTSIHRSNGHQEKA